MYAPNPYCAYIPCSIIIETRPEKDRHKEIVDHNQSFFVYCVEIEFRHRLQDRPATKTNLFYMFIAFVCFSPLGHGIRCKNLSGSLLTRRFWQLSTVRAQLKSKEMQKAKEAVLYHLETLNPEFHTVNNTLTVTVPPLDPKLFLPDEACSIIRQTLAQSLTFIHEWTCTLHTIN